MKLLYSCFLAKCSFSGFYPPTSAYILLTMSATYSSFTVEDPFSMNSVTFHLLNFL